MKLDVEIDSRSCRVVPLFLGLVLAFSDSAALAHSTRPLPGTGAVSDGEGLVFSTGLASSAQSMVSRARRLLFSTRNLAEEAGGDTDEAPHDHGGHIDTHTHANGTEDHTHVHAHNNTSPHAHEDDAEEHSHEEHTHDDLGSHAHADSESAHEHDCHTHDGLAPHRHGDDAEGHEHTDLEGVEPCETACTPSTIPEFDCMDSLLGGNVIFHYQAFQTGDTSAKMAIESPHEGGWAALGFGSSMLGTTAVIATTKAANGGIGVFNLGGYSPDAITEYDGAVAGSSGSGRRLADASAGFTISDASVERSGDRLVARFTRAYDDSFRGDADIAAIVAYHGSDAALTAVHEMRVPVGLSLNGGGVTIEEDNTPKLRRWHAGLMLVSWGMLLPLGVIMAATMRTFGPKSMWFQLHRTIQTLGLLLATIGFFIAVGKFDSLPSGDSHKRLGIAVMVMGWLQPINALFRPHAPEAGEKRPPLRIAWEILHKCVGWACVSLAVSTIVHGLQHAKTFEGLSENYLAMRNGYIAVGIMLLVLLVVLLPFHIIRTRKQCAESQRATGEYVKSATPEAEMVGAVHSIAPPDSP